MKIPLVDLSTQYQRHKAEIDAAIERVIAETAFVGNMTNRFVSEFESAFAQYCGATNCVACANGTDAIEIALRALGIGPGDEVIVPAVSWIATSEAVSNVGGTPIFADISDRLFTLSPEKIEEAITDRTKAIIPVHLYGNPAEMSAILAIARRRGLYVIEDCAQAHGATYEGKMVGTLGTVGCFSFFPGKNLGAYGDAGGIITSDKNLAETCRMISQHGQSSAKHDHKIEGRNSRLDGIQAAVLSVKLRYLKEWTRQRQANAELYKRALEHLGIPIQETTEGGSHVYHLFTVQVSNRASVQSALAAHGVATGVQYPRALPDLSAYKGRSGCTGNYSVARSLAERTLSLPMYPELTEEQISKVTRCLSAALHSKYTG